MQATTAVRSSSRRRLRPLIPVVMTVLLALTTCAPANGAGPAVGDSGGQLVGDDGSPRLGTYVPEVVPDWKAQLLVLQAKRRAGTSTDSDASQWSALLGVVAQQINPTLPIFPRRCPDRWRRWLS